MRDDREDRVRIERGIVEGRGQRAVQAGPGLHLRRLDAGPHPGRRLRVQPQALEPRQLVLVAAGGQRVGDGVDAQAGVLHVEDLLDLLLR